MAAAVTSLVPFDDSDLDLTPEPPEFAAFAAQELAALDADERGLDADLLDAGAALAVARGDIDAARTDVFAALQAFAGLNPTPQTDALISDVQDDVDSGDAVLAEMDAELAPAPPPPPPPPPPVGGGGVGGGGGGGVGGGGGGLQCDFSQRVDVYQDGIYVGTVCEGDVGALLE